MIRWQGGLYSAKFYIMMDLFIKSKDINGIFHKHDIFGIPGAFAVINEFTGIDQGDPHDHPWDFTSFVLKGSYIERRYTIRNDGSFLTADFNRRKGESFYVKAGTIHRIIALPEGHCVTIINSESESRKWGFYRFGTEILHRFWDETEFKPYKP